MKKIHYPGIEARTVHHEMAEILQRLHSDAQCACGRQRDCEWYPHVDIYETQDDILVLAECSGVEKDALELEVEGNILLLQGRRKDPLAGRGRIKAHNMEITYGTFKRSITIDIPFDREKINAAYKDGFLTLTIPKTRKEPVAVKVDDRETSEE